MTLPKEDNKFSVCDPKEMEIYKLAGKVFNMIILRKFRKLPQTTPGYQCLNNTRDSTETEILKKLETEILDLKNIIYEIKMKQQKPSTSVLNKQQRWSMNLKAGHLKETIQRGKE